MELLVLRQRVGRKRNRKAKNNNFRHEHSVCIDLWSRIWLLFFLRCNNLTGIIHIFFRVVGSSNARLGVLILWFLVGALVCPVSFLSAKVAATISKSMGDAATTGLRLGWRQETFGARYYFSRCCGENTYSLAVYCMVPKTSRGRGNIRFGKHVIRNITTCKLCSTNYFTYSGRGCNYPSRYARGKCKTSFIF